MAAALLAQLAALEADLPLAARLEAARPPPVTISPKDDDERPLMREPPPQRPSLMREPTQDDDERPLMREPPPQRPSLMREPTPHHVKQTPTASFVANGSRHPPLAAAAIDTADDGMAPQVHELTAATKAEATRSPRARPHARQESPPAGRQAHAVDNELPEAPASDAGLPSAAAGSTTRNSAAVERARAHASVAASSAAVLVQQLQAQLAETRAELRDLKVAQKLAETQSQLRDLKAAERSSIVEQLQAQLAQLREGAAARDAAAADAAATAADTASAMATAAATATAAAAKAAKAAAAAEELEVGLSTTRAEIDALKVMLAHSRCQIDAAHELVEQLRCEREAGMLGEALSDETRCRLQLAFERSAPIVKNVSALRTAKQLQDAVLDACVAPFGLTIGEEEFAHAAAASGTGTVSFDAYCDFVRQHMARQSAVERCFGFATERIGGWTALRNCLEGWHGAVASATERCRPRQTGASGDHRDGEGGGGGSGGSGGSASIPRSAAEEFAFMSDAYEYVNGSAGERVLHASRHGQPPFISLDARFYKDATSLKSLLPCGPPSLRRCTSLKIVGRVTIGNEVAFEGDVAVINRGAGVRELPSGVYMDEELEL